MKKFNIAKIIIPVTLAFAAIAFVLAFYSLYFMFCALLLGALSIIIIYRGISKRNKELEQLADNILHENRGVATRMIYSLDIPCLLFDSNGRIRWRNEAFAHLYSGTNLTKLLPELDLTQPQRNIVLEMKSASYDIKNLPVERHESTGRKLIFQYWVDRTEALHYRRLYEEQRPTVCLIYIDNYEDAAGESQLKRTAQLAQVEKLISDWVNQLHGVYRRYDTARFFAVFERRCVDDIEKQKFALLDSVRNIQVESGTPLTLSISVGMEPRINESDESARQAMELALGRGGDQAVIKQGTSFRFYGGKRQGMERQSKVKSRQFARALRQLIENATDVFIMGHNQLDMDCIGAALAISRCARTVLRKPYIIVDKQNPGVEQIVDMMRSLPEYEPIIISIDKAAQMIKSTSVLVIVDTQRWNSVIAPNLGSLAGKTVVIDHHRRSLQSMVDSVTMHYLEPNASSVSEMMAEVVQYFDENVKLSPLESGAMLAGITVDTKRFAFNCGVRTFEAAAYLRRSGADAAMIKRLFQDDLQTYTQRAEIVKRVTYVADGIAISDCPEYIGNPSLMAAQAADEIISIRGIHASFVLARYSPEMIVVSGRSIGDINVQMILERLGGGGHLTVAGAQLYNVTMEQAIDLVKKSIKSYLAEEEHTYESHT